MLSIVDVVRSLVALTAAAIMCAHGPAATASPIIVDFEGFSDGSSITNEIAGVSILQGGLVLTAGLSLNEVDFPPRSGQNVLLGNQTLTFDFTDTISEFTAFVTYAAPVELRIYDSFSQLLFFAVSGFSNNTATSGDPGSLPNEMLRFDAGSGIDRVTLTSAGDFVVDDVTFSRATVPPNPVPEPPGAMLLIAVTGAFLAARSRRR